jgi:hypothetical protein
VTSLAAGLISTTSGALIIVPVAGEAVIERA